MTSGAPTADPHVGRLDFRGAHVHHHLRGLSHGRLRAHLVLVTFIVGLTLAVGVGALVVVLAAHGTSAQCKPYAPCGPASSGVPLVNQTLWRSSRYGFTLEYPGEALSASDQTAAGLTLSFQSGSSSGTLIVYGEPASQAEPSGAITAQLAALRGVSQLATDTNPALRLLGPGVGHHAGAGGTYTGYLDASQGVGAQQTIYAESATDGRVTVTVLAVGSASDAGPKSDLAQVADLVINSVRWPT